MRKMTNQFSGIFPALITPYGRDGKINETALSQLVKMNLEKGVSGFFVGGSSGEAFLLTLEERKYILEIVAQEAKGRAAIIAHIGCISTEQAMELARHAADVGADAISSVPPFYYKFTMDELQSYYLDIVSEVSLPMIVYHVPALTDVALSNENLERLLADPRIVGVKYTSFDLFQMQRMAAKHPDKFVLNGYDEVFLGALAMGAKGAIGSTINVMADKFVRIQRLFNEGKLEEAYAVQEEANKVIEVLIKIGVFQGVKAILEMMGISCGNCRKPFRNLKDEEKDILRNVFNFLK